MNEHFEIKSVVKFHVIFAWKYMGFQCLHISGKIKFVKWLVPMFYVLQLKEKLEKTHEAMQKARSQRQLEQAKQANIEKLVSVVIF